MIAFIFATLAEAAPLIERVNADPKATERFPVYTFSLPEHLPPECVIIISGMGTENATRATQYALAEFHLTRIINPGIAGAAAAEMIVGDVYRIAETRAEQSAPPVPPPIYACAAGAFSTLPTARLTTVATPVFDSARKKEIARWGELIDMEGAAIAAICAERKIDCTLIKGVSDFADEVGRDTLQQNITTVSTIIAETLLRDLQPATSDIATPQSVAEPVGFSQAILRFTRIEHTAFSLPLLFAGAWLGAGEAWPPWHFMLLIILAATGARTFGMAVNRIADRAIDAQNPRTENRELPAEILTLKTAIIIAGGGLLVYLIACVFIDGWVMRLLLIPLVPLVGYSFLKRFTVLCHFGIGLALAQAPLCAYIAAGNSLALSRPVLLLAAFTFLWLAGADIIYAVMDMASDRQNGIYSIPAKFGEANAHHIALALHLFAALAAGGMAYGAGNVLGYSMLGVTLVCLSLLQVRSIPLLTRFFPIAALAGVAGAVIPMSGGIL